METLQVPTYEHSDDQVAETAQAAIAYIFEGDPLNEVYDLQGLVVYGVIAALREQDEILHGERSTLNAEQQARLVEVETVVDEAVDSGMQFYPFGDYHNRRNIPTSEFSQLAAAKQNRTGRIRLTSAIRRSERRRYNGSVSGSSPAPGPVTKSRLD